MRERERESEGEERERGEESVRGDTTAERKRLVYRFTERTYGIKRFLIDLLFQCHANPIACIIVKVIPSKHVLYFSPVPHGVSQIIPSPSSFCFKMLFLFCIAAPRLRTTETGSATR